MTINQPGQSQDPVEQSWKLEVTRAINDLQTNPAVAAGTVGTTAAPPEETNDPLTVTVVIFQRTLTAPTTPNSTTYNRTTGPAVPTGWSLDSPAPDGVPVYSSRAQIIASEEDTPTLEWQAPALVTQDGNKTYVRYAAKLDASRQDSELVTNTVVSDQTTFTPGGTDSEGNTYSPIQGFSAWPSGNIELNVSSWTYQGGTGRTYGGQFSATPDTERLMEMGSLTPDSDTTLTGQSISFTWQRVTGSNDNNTVRIRLFDKNGTVLGSTGGIALTGSGLTAVRTHTIPSIATFVAGPDNPLYFDFRIQSQSAGQNAVYQLRELELSVPEGITVPYPSIFFASIQPNTRYIGTVQTTSPTPPADGASYIWSRYSSTGAGSAPTSSSSPGTEGDFEFDDTYLYYYTGTRWHRIAWDTTTW